MQSSHRQRKVKPWSLYTLRTTTTRQTHSQQTTISRQSQKTLPNKYQKQITQTIKQCNLVLNKERNKYLTVRNPKPPTLKAQIKLHKDGNPIRPVINNIHAPSYKTAKRLNKILQHHINLDNQYTVINSATLAQNLTRLNINSKHSLITFDIKDVHIPIAETIDITTTQLLKHNDPETTTQICTLLGVIQ